MTSNHSDSLNDQHSTSISIWQKLDFLPAILQTLIGTAGAALFAPFRGQYAPKTFKRHVVLSLMRRAVERFSPTQLQWLAGTTRSSYLTWTKTQNIEPKSEVLPKAHASAFWVGDPAADIVTLYYHGGGFAMPAGDGQFKFMSQIEAAATASGKSLAFLVLQYDLAPGKQYPHQLRQCIELLRYAVTDLKKSPKQLMLGGDSAGGNLVFAVLLHLLHPHPEINPLKLSQPLKVAFASSPWIDFDMSSERWQDSDASDAASIKTLKLWAQNYVGSRKSDIWLEPAKAKTAEWTGLEGLVDEILITIAKKEVMADDVRGLVANIESVYPKVKLYESPDDFHAEPVLGSNVGFETGDAAKVIKSWVVDKC